MSNRPTQPSDTVGSASAYEGNAASRYVDWRKRNLSRRVSRWFERRAVLKAAAEPMRTLDIPSGETRFPGVISCDRSLGMARLARDAGSPAVRGDAFALPFSEGAFERVLCVRFLHHFAAPERRRALGELRRVGARAVVTYFGDRGFKSWRRRRKRDKQSRRGVSAPDFAEDCAAAGWSVVTDRAVWPLLSEQRVVVLE